MAYWGRPRGYQSVEDFDTAIDSYFQEIEDQNKESVLNTGKYCRVPNMAGLCNHMGMVKQTFYDYAQRMDGNGNKFMDSCKRAVQLVENFKLEQAQLGHIKEVSTIFDLKNNHGYTDKTEVTIPQEPNKLTADRVKEKLQEIKNKKKPSSK